jgi:hypothetical protein
MSSNNAPAAASPQQVGASAARAAESETLLQAPHYLRALAGINPFAASAGLGLGASLPAVNPFLLQQEIIRRQELERTLAVGHSTSGSAYSGHDDSELDVLSRRENELLRIRNAHNQIVEAELLARSARMESGLPMASVAGLGGGLPFAGMGGFGLGLGSAGLGLGAETETANILLASRQRALEAASMPAPAAQIPVASEATRLSAEERDQLSKAADQSYRTALEANGLPAAGLANSEDGRKIGDKDLAHEAELHENVQRQLMEQEAIAEQQKKQAAAAARTQALMGGTGLDLERMEMFRRQQQEEMLRLIQLQQLQLPGDNLLSLQSRMHGAMALPMTSPYAAMIGGMGLGGVFTCLAWFDSLFLSITNNCCVLQFCFLTAQIPFQAAAPLIDPRIAAANIEKAYSAEGSPENDIIAKFLNVVTSRVPEIMDMIAYFFPVGVVDNPEKFKAEFPRVVEATLSELTLMQDRASKENGYKSRGLYDRVTNCIAGELGFSLEFIDVLTGSH